jgi:drug/metabolite transporter (DMT)-like permease
MLPSDNGVEAMDTSRRAVGYLFLTLAMVGVGSTVVVSKIIAGALPPFAATALRFAIALPLFLLLLRLTRTPWPRLGRRDLVLVLVQAGAGSVGYTVLLIVGLTFTSAADAGVITGTLPAVMGAIAVLLLGERLDRRLLASIGLATAGVLVITLQFDGTGLTLSSWSALLGNALVLAAVVCEGLFLLLNKRLRAPVPPLALSTLMSLFGLAISAIPAAIEMSRYSGGGVPVAALAGVVYYALVPTVLGFVLWYEGTTRTSGAEAALFTAVLPVSAVLLAALVLGESVSVQQAIGVAFVIAAIMVGVVRRPRAMTAIEQPPPNAAGPCASE